MARLYFTNKAVEDLETIWTYTVKTWSENQAEIYYSLLIDSCQKLALKPTLGKSYEVVEKNVFGFKTGEHLIFYKVISPQEIEVIRILHGIMDLKTHLWFSWIQIGVSPTIKLVQKSIFSRIQHRSFPANNRNS